MTTTAKMSRCEECIWGGRQCQGCKEEACPTCASAESPKSWRGFNIRPRYEGDYSVEIGGGQVGSFSTKLDARKFIDADQNGPHPHTPRSGQ